MWSSLLEFIRKLGTVDVKPSMVQLEIDGLVYTSTKLAADDGLEIWPRVLGLIGPALTRAIAMGEDFEPTADMLTAIADRAQRDGLTPLARMLLVRVQCNAIRPTGAQGDLLPHFGSHFAGEYVHLLKVCMFALSHNLRGPTLGAA